MLLLLNVRESGYIEIDGESRIKRAVPDPPIIVTGSALRWQLIATVHYGEVHETQHPAGDRRGGPARRPRAGERRIRIGSRAGRTAPHRAGEDPHAFRGQGRSLPAWP